MRKGLSYLLETHPISLADINSHLDGTLSFYDHLSFSNLTYLLAILSLGETPYSLCEPILRSCSAEQLLALEKNSLVRGHHIIMDDVLRLASVSGSAFRK